jgi:hypothetical protein
MKTPFYNFSIPQTQCLCMALLPLQHGKISQACIKLGSRGSAVGGDCHC